MKYILPFKKKIGLETHHQKNKKQIKQMFNKLLTTRLEMYLGFQGSDIGRFPLHVFDARNTVITSLLLLFIVLIV